MDSKEVEDCQKFTKALRWSVQVGMEFEFFNSFIEHVTIGYTVPESIFHANREWDL